LSVVPNLGSGGGLKALAAGRLDLAIASRRPNEAERAAGLVEREVFRSPLVWAVNPDVPLRQATRAELVALYQGRSATWPNGQPVRLVLRPDSDIDTQLLRALGPEMDEALSAASRRPGMTVALTDDETALHIERIPGALGTVTLGLLLAQDRTLPLLKVTDLPASAAALADGRYPLVKRFYLVTRAQPTPEVAAVLQAMASRAAAERLARLGCQPVGMA
jgi:phosphate transport system substrate-binding protein